MKPEIDINFEYLGTEQRQDLTIEQLMILEDPCVVFEGRRTDSDGERYWVYTVGGHIDGVMVGGQEGGALVGGETIIVHARNKKEADEMAYDGLTVTIKIENDKRRAHEKRSLDNKGNEGIIALVDALPRHLH